MAVTKRNYIRGAYETVTSESVGTPTLNTWNYFELDNYFKFELADVALYQGGSPVPSAAYELKADDTWTAEEAKTGGSEKTLYKMWRITNATYAGIATTVSGKNFGTMVDNEAVYDYIYNNIGRPVGDIYTQHPFQPAPSTLFPGTWVNISEKAAGYELSVSGWVSREAVGQTLWTETDYGTSDTISGSPGGTYDGETVSTVFTMAGQVKRVEGGNGENFEEGTQLDQMQGHWHAERVEADGFDADSRNPANYRSGDSAGNVSINALTYSQLNTKSIVDAISDGTNGTPRIGTHTRDTSFTVRIWKRTA